MLTTIGCRPSRNSGIASRINSTGAKKFTSMIGRKRAGIGFGESAVGGDAGVVDENIEAAELVAGRVERALAQRGIGHVAGDTNRAPAELHDFCGNFRKSIFAARDKNADRRRAAPARSPAPARCRSMHR